MERKPKKIIITEAQANLLYGNMVSDDSLYNKKYYYTLMSANLRKDWRNICRNIKMNGLTCGDSDSNLIFFNADPDEYNRKHDKLELAITLTPELRKKYKLVANFSNLQSHIDIPFEDLEIECAPVVAVTDIVSGLYETWTPQMLNEAGIRERLREINNTDHIRLYFFRDMIELFGQKTSPTGEDFSKVIGELKDESLKNAIMRKYGILLEINLF